VPGRQQGPFDRAAEWYDRIYSWRDYRTEAEGVRRIVRMALGPGRHRLLDVACGTGRHLAELRKWFEVEGVDISAPLLEQARVRLPRVRLRRADMTGFDLGRRFDVVMCLFSSIGYVRTRARLEKAIGCMAAHLAPGGVLIVEPWFTPGQWRRNTPHALLLADDPELKIARLNTSFGRGRRSWFDLHYLIATPARTTHCVERHELGLFTVAEMKQAFRRAGLRVACDSNGLTGRGLYLGRNRP